MNPPESLLELQEWMSKFLIIPLREQGDLRLPIFDPAIEREIEEKMVGGPRLSAAQKFAIHNLQFWFRMYILIQADYPGLMLLFGYGNFNREIVEPYILEFLPNHWSLDSIGDRLPLWIEKSYQEEDKPLILPISQIDAIYKRLLFTQALPAPKNLHEQYYLQPFVALLELEADFLPFREQLVQKDIKYWQENDFPSLDWSRKRKYAIYLFEDRIVWEELKLAEWILLKAFETGATLSDACDLLVGELAEEAEPQIVSWFQKWAERNWFAAKIDD